MKVACKVCKKELERIRSDKTNSKGFPIFVDEHGKDWHGFKCSACRREPLPYKKNKGSQVSWAKKSGRKCAVCNKPLRADRYFKHRSCDLSHAAAHSNGHTESIWTGEEYGASYCEYGSGY